MAQSLKQYKAEQIQLSEKRLNTAHYPKDLTIVAEGDSWFDYPFKKDILDYLVDMGFAIKKFAKAGDTLENMVYGTNYQKIPGDQVNITHPGPISLQTTLNAIRDHKPKIVLLSAGGNDVVGSDMIAYLNHKHGNPASLINKVIYSEKLAQMKSTLEYFIKAVHSTYNGCQILMDGYDYGKVNGKGYNFIFKNIKGPWIQPAMGAKAITHPPDQEFVIKYLVDAFNEMLSELANSYSYFHHIDLRGMFPEDEHWDNEIHLKNNGYKKVAGAYKNKISEVLGVDPIVHYKSDIIV
jgi:hypothetical protein